MKTGGMILLVVACKITLHPQPESNILFFII